MVRTLALSAGIFALLAAISGCTLKVGGQAPTNYDYSEYQTYDQPHAASPEWGAGSIAGAVGNAGQKK